MLQRIQSIFLLLVALSMIVFVMFPLWKKVDTKKNEVAEMSATRFVHSSVDTVEVISEKNTIYIAVLALIAAGVAFYSISRHDNRLTQMKLGAMNSLIIGATLMLTFYHIWEIEKVLSPDTKGIYSYYFYAAIGALLFNMIANRFIRRDEKLVKSADRIR